MGGRKLQAFIDGTILGPVALERLTVPYLDPVPSSSMGPIRQEEVGAYIALARIFATLRQFLPCHPGQHLVHRHGQKIHSLASRS
jgi:hypothetical protein